MFPVHTYQKIKIRSIIINKLTMCIWLWAWNFISFWWCMTFHIKKSIRVYIYARFCSNSQTDRQREGCIYIIISRYVKPCYKARCCKMTVTHQQQAPKKDQSHWPVSRNLYESIHYFWETQKGFLICMFTQVIIKCHRWTYRVYVLQVISSDTINKLDVFPCYIHIFHTILQWQFPFASFSLQDLLFWTDWTILRCPTAIEWIIAKSFTLLK